MKKEELFSLIDNFSDRPVPATSGRHVYLWHGSIETLMSEIPRKICQKINLHKLVARFKSTPRAQDQASRLIWKSIQDTLAESSHSGQHIFVITGCDLLSRYRVPLKVFFERASEERMFLFALSSEDTNFQPTGFLPNYVLFNPTAAHKYLKEVIGEAATIELSGV